MAYAFALAIRLMPSSGENWRADGGKPAFYFTIILGPNDSKIQQLAVSMIQKYGTAPRE
jgi:hypothetical protein